jgi:Tfp pilus assembly protein PilZ
MEKRRFARLPKCLPLEYCYSLPGSGEIYSGKGISQNLSLGGIYLKCDPPHPPLGQLIDLTVTEIIHQPIGYITHKFKAAGRVVRLEPAQDDSPHLGVAVQFLTPTNLSEWKAQIFS